MHSVHRGTFSCMSSVQQGFLECMCEKQQRVKQARFSALYGNHKFRTTSVARKSEIEARKSNLQVKCTDSGLPRVYLYQVLVMGTKLEMPYPKCRCYASMNFICETRTSCNCFGVKYGYKAADFKRFLFSS